MRSSNPDEGQVGVAMEVPTAKFRLNKTLFQKKQALNILSAILEKKSNLELMRAINEIFTNNPENCVRRIRVFLKRRKYPFTI